MKNCREGHVTVFLSMIFMCMMTLMCALLETARTTGARYFLQMAANSAADSVFSQFHKNVWEKYRIFTAEYTEKEDIKTEHERYMNKYLQVSDWYEFETPVYEKEQLVHMVDDHGIWFEKEILDFMKYEIWDCFDLKPDQAKTMFDFSKGASAVKEASGYLGEDSKAAWRLEKVLSSIEKNIEKQETLKIEGVSRLLDEDGSGFKNTADHLNSEIKKIPGLVKKYEKAADELAAEIEKTQNKIALKYEEMSREDQQYFENQIAEYKSYVDQDGERRKQIESLAPLSESNVEFVNSVKEQVDEIEEIIDDWEPEDEDDEEPDFHYLWEEAADRFGTLFVGKTDYKSCIKDEESEGLLEAIEKISGDVLLELVIPSDRTVSSKTVHSDHFPSRLLGDATETDQGNLITRILTDEYGAKYFRSFTDHNTDGSVEYELEYLLSGETSDRKNITAAIEKILVLRTGLNFQYLITNPDMVQSAQTLAMAITGAGILLPIVSVITAFILGVWAFGEGLMDVKALLSGDKVVFFKTRDTWKLGIEQLLEIAKNKILPQSSSSERGFCYETYLKIFMLMQNSEKKYYYMLDMIQANMELEEKNFRISKCIYSMDLKGKIELKNRFSLFRKLGDSQYEYEYQSQKAY